MKKIILAASILCFSFNADAVCKNISSLKGNYVISSQYIGHIKGEVVSCGVTGLMNFDGKGGTTLTHLSGCGGILPINGSYAKEIGNYTLENTCSGKATFSEGDPEEEITLFYIFDNNLTKASFVFNGINTISGSGSMFKQ